MAVSSMSRTCAFSDVCSALSRTGSKRLAHTTRSTTQSRPFSYCPPPPPHLDFLAPAWIHTPGSHKSAHQIVRAPVAVSRRHITSPLRAAQQVNNAHRGFSTTTPRSTAIANAILNPRTADDGTPLAITITPRAAQRLQAIAATDGNPDLALRVTVESGGCHGFQYLMSLTSTGAADAEEDTIFENGEVVPGKGNGDYKAKVIMDEPSLELLKGSSVDYTMELIGSQFKVTGIPGAKSSCGCGTSFDISV